MVPRADDIDILLSKYFKSIFALGIRSIVEPIPFYPVSSVHKQQVNAFIVGFLVQSLGQGYVVAPVGAEGGSALGVS